MGREISDSETFSESHEEMQEPEEDDFFKEVVENSLRRKKANKK